MTTFIEQHEYTKLADSTSDQLLPIATEILNVRMSFFNHLEALPAPFNDFVKEHYLARLVRAEDRHMLGEYSPFMLADLLHIPYEIATEIAVPWLVLYEHNLLIDDIIDIRDESLAQNTLLSQLLFADCIALWQSRFLKHQGLWQIFSKYHQEGILAVVEELRLSSHSFNTIFGSADISSTNNHLSKGRKAALVKFCAAALTAEYYGRFLTSSEEIGLDKLCTGIQLLDDLTDSMEDYKQQRYNYPLQMAVVSLRCQYGFDPLSQYSFSEDKLLSLLVLSGVAKDVSKQACLYLTDGMKDLQITLNSTTGKYLYSLIDCTLYSSKALENIMNEQSTLIETMLLSLFSEEYNFDQLIIKSSYKKIWTEIKLHFKNIASASN